MGTTGFGEMADSLVELDHRVGQIVVEVDALGLGDDTLTIFASDNGPEFRGPWRDTYHTAREGRLRAPAIFCWLDRIAPGRASDEIVHVCDLYTTLANIVGAAVPSDRAVDGVDQAAFLLGDTKSAREGFVYFIKEDLKAAKWREWKCHYYWEPDVNHSKGKLDSPLLFHLIQDLKEETDILLENTWALGPIYNMVHAFRQSLKEHLPIPPGTPDPYTPP